MSDDNINSLDLEEEIIVVGFTLAGSFLSLFGASFIIWAYLKFENLRNFAFKLVFWLSISDLIFCIGKILILFEISSFYNNLWGSNDALCQMQALLINYGGLASVTCTVTIAWTLYTSLIKAELQLEAKYENSLWRFAFGFPFFMTILPIFSGDYGPAGSWCWIKNSNRSLAWRFFEFYIPLWIAIIFNSYSYYKVIKFIQQEMHDNLDDRLTRRFMLYPLILVICWLPATINRINTLFFKASMFLNILHRLFGSLQGILNAIIYGMNSNVRSEIKGYMRSHWFFKRFFKKSGPYEQQLAERGSDYQLNDDYKMSTNNEQLLRLARLSSDVELQLKQLDSK